MIGMQSIMGCLARFVGRRGSGRPASPGVPGVMRCLFPLLLLCGCASPLPPPSYEPAPPTPRTDLNAVKWGGQKPTLADLDQYVENFRNLAFETENHGPHPWVRKFSGSNFCAPEQYREAIEPVLQKMRIITGLGLRVAFDHCDVMVHDSPNMRGCGASPGAIFVGRGAPLDECLEEEIAQHSGIYNDISYRWTMFNDATNGAVNRLTWHDAVMLRVLYQQELHQGMTEDEAMRIVPRLMRKVIGEVQ